MEKGSHYEGREQVLGGKGFVRVRRIVKVEGGQEERGGFVGNVEKNKEERAW